MKTFAIVLFLTVIIVDILAQERIDVNKSIATVKNCYSADIDAYNKCLLEFWVEVGPLLKDGIPELSIPKLDPATIPKIEVNQDGSLADGFAVFTDVVINGISTFVPKKVNVDISAKTVAVDLFIPQLTSEGNYFLDGVVMLLPIKGNGTFALKLFGVDGKAVGHVEREGASGVRLEKLNIDFEVKNLTIHLTDLFEGDGVTEALNNLINDNAQEILADVKPVVKSRIEEVISKFVGGLVKVLPADSFLPADVVAKLDA